ncbi:hypothetical protein Tco_1053650 [Tanacetum coccineum]|uniref:Retrotransposon gag domain-containing protein n=1 Tax=Tanacetum coccineum TaxID=301880 RepID=A0ABQ5GUN5_9ASTR
MFWSTIEYGVSTSTGYGVSSSLSNTSYSIQLINTAYPLPLDTTYRLSGTETEIIDFHAKFFLLSFGTNPTDCLSLVSEYSEEEEEEEMAETMEQYMSKTRTDYGSGVARPKIDNKDQFELKGQFIKELRENKFSGSDNEDANEHIKKNEPTGSINTWEDLKTKFLNKYCPLGRTAKKMEEINNFKQDETLYQAYECFKELLMKCPQHYLTEMREVILFYNGLDIPTRQILDSRGAIPTMTTADAKKAIQEMEEYSQKWYNGTSRGRSTETSDGLAAIQEQLNNLGREIKKVNEKVYAAQVGCEQCKGPRGRYKATAPRYYQRNNANPLFQERRQSMEYTLRKFMNESAKRHEENSNLIKEIQASTDAAIRNQGASIKTLEIQIRKMSKVPHERGFGSLPSSTETNPRDQVKSISTSIKADSNLIHRIGSNQYAVSTGLSSTLLYKGRQTTVPYLSRLDNHYCEEEENYGPKFTEAYEASHINNAIPRKEKDPRSFTLPCFINDFCFDNVLVDLGSSVGQTAVLNYVPVAMYGLCDFMCLCELICVCVGYVRLDNQSIERDRLIGIGLVLNFVKFISFTFGDKEMIIEILTFCVKCGNGFRRAMRVELADRTVKYPKGIAENVLVGIGKFNFPIDFIFLDMPEDIKVPLILERPFLSTARAKIDVYKRKITLRVGEEKIIFKSDKPTSSIIQRVYMLSLRERMELDLEARLMGETLVINRSLDRFLEDYIELYDLNEPFELRRNQGDDLMPTIKEGEVIEEFRTRNEELSIRIDDYPRALMNVPIFVGTFSVMTDFAVLENMDAYRDEGMGDVDGSSFGVEDRYIWSRSVSCVVGEIRRLRIGDATAAIQLWGVHMYMMIPKDCHHPGGRNAYIGAYFIYLDNCNAFLKHNDSEDTSSAEGCQFGKELLLLIYILSTSLLLHLLFCFYFFRKPEKNKKNLLSTFSKGLLVRRK